ncbi:hypothetical protein C8R45DRAFT_1089160 [Mycena sanguinolenta]|nr:hypothetical protein C8R45DRAFT_1089160 [Mycena sanguinolenta]
MTLNRRLERPSRAPSHPMPFEHIPESTPPLSISGSHQRPPPYHSDSAAAHVFCAIPSRLVVVDFVRTLAKPSSTSVPSALLLLPECYLPLQVDATRGCDRFPQRDRRALFRWMLGHFVHPVDSGSRCSRAPCATMIDVVRFDTSCPPPAPAPALTPARRHPVVACACVCIGTAGGDAPLAVPRHDTNAHPHVHVPEDLDDSGRARTLLPIVPCGHFLSLSLYPTLVRDAPTRPALRHRHRRLAGQIARALRPASLPSIPAADPFDDRSLNPEFDPRCCIHIRPRRCSFSSPD